MMTWLFLSVGKLEVVQQTHEAVTGSPGFAALVRRSGTASRCHQWLDRVGLIAWGILQYSARLQGKVRFESIKLGRHGHSIFSQEKDAKQQLLEFLQLAFWYLNHFTSSPDVKSWKSFCFLSWGEMASESAVFSGMAGTAIEAMALRSMHASGRRLTMVR